MESDQAVKSWKMALIYWMIISVLTVIPTDVCSERISLSSRECSAGCQCFYRERQKYQVDCSRRSLTLVPGGIPKFTTFLNLDYNKIQTIYPDDFVELTSLEILSLSQNSN